MTVQEFYQIMDMMAIFSLIDEMCEELSEYEMYEFHMMTDIYTPLFV